MFAMRAVPDFAHCLQDHGYPVVILDGKRPIHPGWQLTRSTHELIDEWWSYFPRGNVGIHTGFSGIAVADCDVLPDGSCPAAEWVASNLPESPTYVRSPSGGLHVYFRDGGETPNRLNVMGIKLDLRARFSQVVSAPSYSRERRTRWEMLGELVSPSELPILPTDWLADAERAIPPEPVRKPEIDRPDMRRVYAYLDVCPRAVSGMNGHTTCFRCLTNCLRAFPWLTESQFREAALYYDATKCDPPFGPGRSGIEHKILDSLLKVRGS